MSELLYSVAVPFKRKGKEALKESDFVLALSIDLHWFNPEQAKNILNQAEKAGLIKKEGELIMPAFDLNSVEIPTGFKPDSGAFEKKPVFEGVIERMIAATGMEKRKVISLINKKQEELSKLVEIEVSALLVALENGVSVDDLIDEECAALLTPSSSS